MSCRSAILVAPLEEEADRRHAHVASRLVDGEVDVPEPGKRDVVVPDQRHVGGHVEAVVVERVEGPTAARSLPTKTAVTPRRSPNNVVTPSRPPPR